MAQLGKRCTKGAVSVSMDATVIEESSGGGRQSDQRDGDNAVNNKTKKDVSSNKAETAKVVQVGTNGQIES